jgi:hypothetical protein
MKLKIIKNYYLFFDDSAFSKEGDNVQMEIQPFRSKKNAIKTIKDLEKVKEVSFVFLWRKRTNVCYIYKYVSGDWGKEKHDVISKMGIIYKFKTKKTLVIKEMEDKRDKASGN